MTKKIRWIISVIPLLCSCASNSTTAIYTTAPIIATPSDQDYGFVGTWRADPREALSDATQVEMRIRLGDDSGTRYVVEDARDPDGFRWDCTMTPLSESDNVVFVQAQVINEKKRDSSPYFYAVACVIDDKMLLWFFDTERFVDLIKKEELNSVIDRHFLVTEVVANPDKLLNLIKAHSREMIEKDPRIYSRVQSDNVEVEPLEEGTANVHSSQS